MLRQLAVAGLLAIPGSLHAQQAASPLETAAFMAGCWRGPVGQDRVIEEYYTTPQGNLMQGMTRYLRGKLVVDYEFTLLDVDRNTIRLRPHPKGQPSVAFAQKESTPGRIVWENLAHDFPQRIWYEKAAGDSLIARIAGPSANGERVFEYRMGRVSCPGVR
jgi:hypothetical protein